MKNGKNVLKSGCFYKILFCDRDCKYFFYNKGAASDVMCKNILLADLLGSQHLLELLQTSLIFKNSEKAVKSECSKKH